MSNQRPDNAFVVPACFMGDGMCPYQHLPRLRFKTSG